MGQFQFAVRQIHDFASGEHDSLPFLPTTTPSWPRTLEGPLLTPTSAQKDLNPASIVASGITKILVH